jgi:hypothetical protein
MSEIHFNGDHIKDSLELLRSGAKGQSIVYKMASGRYHVPIKKYWLSLINILLTTILVAIPILILFSWLRK